MKYDVLIVGAGPGGIFAAYELMNNDPEKKIAVFEAGHPLEKKKMSHRRKESKILYPLQNLCDHEGIWRCRRFLRRKI